MNPEDLLGRLVTSFLFQSQMQREYAVGKFMSTNCTEILNIIFFNGSVYGYVDVFLQKEL